MTPLNEQKFIKKMKNPTLNLHYCTTNNEHLLLIHLPQLEQYKKNIKPDTKGFSINLRSNTNYKH